MNKAFSTSLLLLSAAALSLGGCKYYGSALPPEYPLSMDDALSVASDKTAGKGNTQRAIIRQSTHPRIERPSYLPEKELAIVSAPKTLLVWTYPRITDDNTREFGNWSTIFLTDRYEWVRPNTELPDGEDNAGQPAGRPNMGASGATAKQASASDAQGFSKGRGSAKGNTPVLEEDIAPSGNKY